MLLLLILFLSRSRVFFFFPLPTVSELLKNYFAAVQPGVWNENEVTEYLMKYQRKINDVWFDFLQ